MRLCRPGARVKAAFRVTGGDFAWKLIVVVAAFVDSEEAGRTGTEMASEDIFLTYQRFFLPVLMANDQPASKQISLK